MTHAVVEIFWRIQLPAQFAEIAMNAENPVRSTCGNCRHANHDTDDALEGLLACPWFGGTFADIACRVIFRDGDVYAFEAFNGSNGTWRLASGFREIPIGYQHLDFDVTSDGSPFAGDSLSLGIDDELESNSWPRGQSPFLFQQSEPECYCFSSRGAIWRRLWTGGDIGSGTLTVTPTEIVFVKSTPAQRLACSGPRPTTVDDLEQAIAAQGGVRTGIADVTDATLSFDGRGSYGFGKAQVTDVTITDSTGQTTRFRFLGNQSAREFLNCLQ